LEDIVIRELKQDDVEAAVEIAAAAWKPIFDVRRGIIGEELFAALHPDWRKRKVDQVRAACRPDHSARVLVAEKDGRVVGFITFYTNDTSKVAEIGNNAVHPDYQGHGIGAAMYEDVFDRMREVGMRFVKVVTGGDPAHAPARRAYEKVGFDVQVPVVNYYRRL